MLILLWIQRIPHFFIFLAAQSICIWDFSMKLDLKLSIVFASPQDCKRIAKISVKAAHSADFAMKPRRRQILSGNGHCKKSSGYKCQDKNICSRSGQWILNSSRIYCYEMCVPRGGKYYPTHDRKAAAYSELFSDVSQSSDSLVCGSILLNFGPSRRLWFVFLTDEAAKVHREKVSKAACCERIFLGLQQNCDLHMPGIFSFIISQMWRTSWGHPGE